MQTIKSIQAMRGIAALFVAFYHGRGYLNEIDEWPDLGDLLFSSAYFGVDLFFIVSGFVMVYVTVGDRDSSPVEFLVKRFFRVVPLAFLGTVAMYLLQDGIGKGSLVKSLFFIPLRNETPPFFGYSVLSPEWTLTYELCFYGIFAIALSISHKNRTIIAAAGIALMVCTTQFLLGKFSLNPYGAPLANWHNLTAQIVSLMANPLFLEFAIGMVTAVVYLRCKTINRGMIVCLMVGGVAYFMYLCVTASGGGHGLTGIGPACALVLMGIVLFERQAKRFTVPMPLMRLGDWSYGIYLSHGIIVVLISRWGATIPGLGEVSGFGKLAMLLVFTLPLSAFLFFAVEQPCIRLAKRLIPLGA